MSGLFVLVPHPVSDAVLTDTSITEADYPAYAAGTTYAIGDRVLVVASHAIYESLTAGNIGNDPATATAHWLFVSPSNRWKMFDLSSTTQTEFGASGHVSLTFGRSVTAFAAVNTSNLAELRVRLTDPVYGVVYDHTLDLLLRPAQPTWFDWFFGERTRPADAALFDLPNYPNATLRLDATADGNGPARIGVLLAGHRRQYGSGVLYGAQMGMQDYSRKERNAWGDTTLVQRAYAKTTRLTMTVDRDDVDRTHAALIALRATPCLWMPSNNYASATIYGFYTDFDIGISYPTFSECTITLEGLT